MPTTANTTQLQPFRLPADSAWTQWLRTPLESLLALRGLNEVYARVRELPDDRSFAERSLDALGVQCAVSKDDLARVPATGPLVVVANHPFGGLDGLILAALLGRVRPDVKLLANYMLQAIPDMRDTFIFVDPFGRRDSAARNAGPTRAAIRWVRDGGALGIFPAGEVSHLTLHHRAIVDPPWPAIVGRIIQQTGAQVVPVFFEGRNTILFQLMGLLHPRLRTIMLPRELLKKQHSRVALRIGKPIKPAKLADFESPEELVSYLRLRTYILRGRESTPQASDPHDAPPARRRLDAVAAPEPPDVLAGEIASLPRSQHLVASKEFDVFYANASQAPEVLREIGRLRELTFRGVGEGTGKARDLDRFDDTYLHLFVWNRDTRQVVGAYRMGLTDQIVPYFGPAGLYTSTLFRYRGRTLLDQISPAIELGRSFVRPEYQREYAPLMLLWRGIGQFVVQRPQYRNLFGPVSISNEYHSLSRHLLVAFLRMNRFLPALAQLLSPRHPPPHNTVRDVDPNLPAVTVREIEEVDDLVAEIESDRLTMPILLRQYLRLNAKFMGFNVDPAFGNALDALMLVDLTQVDRRVLGRYMGAEGMESFLRCHGAR